ncbi:N-acetylmuramoyl-L-alanine amidase [Pseudahrensia aquimaris]|uniref:N-acetylmuramoyl-L-alanine amidase n=1 Tax=Pseudahrensia aquimaris TaxID=744461 RepID=A0ABW3FLL0_9HYPH
MQQPVNPLWFAWRYVVLPFGVVVVLWASLLGVGMALAQDEQDAKAMPPIAFAGRIVGNDERFRLIVDFDKDVKRDVVVLDNPRRLIIDMDEVVFSLGEQLTNSPSSLVRGVRFGSIAPGRSRIVVSLNEPIEIRRQSFVELKEQERHRLIIDSVGTTQQRFAAIAKDGEARLARGATAWKGDRVTRPRGPRKTFRVVIDPGHGGIDGGATGRHQSIEKEITLSFAKKLRDELSGNPLIEVLLTREEDTFVSLRERLNFARRHKAHLKISVHADSLGQKNIRGATVYTLSEEGSDSLSRVLAAKQNRADLVAGLSLPEAEKGTTDILIDLTRRETEVFSRQLAHLLVKHLRKSVELINNPNRSADFFVLKAPDVPSVLLELGYLSNDQDEKLMQSVAWRRKAAKSVADAIVDFLEPRMEQ